MRWPSCLSCLYQVDWAPVYLSCDMFLFFSLLIWKSVLLELLYLSIRRRRTDLPDSSVVWYLTLWFDLVLAHLTRWEWWLRWRPHHLLWTQTFGKHGTKREVSNCKLPILCNPIYESIRRVIIHFTHYYVCIELLDVSDLSASKIVGFLSRY